MDATRAVKMRLKLEKTHVRIGEEVEVPDFAFDFVINPMGESVDLIYLVPVDDYSKILSQLTELIPHLKGLYK